MNAKDPVTRRYGLTVLSICCLLVSGYIPAVSSDETASDPFARFQEQTPVTNLDAPDPVPGRAAAYPPEKVEHGRYLVELLGCSSCHTDGALIGSPNFDRLLAGSRVGISYSNPLTQENPGVLYPANLTPDVDTGLGNWSDEQIRQVLQTGIDPNGRHTLSVMPWTTYAKLSRDDALAIVSYLRSLAPVHHEVPENVVPGTKAAEPFIHFGVYRSVP